MSRRLSLALLALALAAPAAADVHPNTAPGFPVEQAFHVGDVDNVNLFNGSLTLTIPLGGSYPVNGGFSYGLKLVYNSGAWDFQSVAVEITDPPDPLRPTYRTLAVPSRCSNAGLGWRLSLGQLDPPCQTPDANGQLPTAVYKDENGTDHLFYPTLHQGDPEDALPTGVKDVLYTRDGTYLRLKTFTSLIRELEFPDGSVRKFDLSGRLTEIRDPFGNKMSVSYATANQWVITDSQNRTHRVYFRTDLPSPSGGGLVDRIELAAFGGATATYTFTYETPTIGRPCPHDDDGVGTGAQVALLTAVTLPDGSAWKTPAADYVTALPPAGAFCTDHAGNLKALTLPTLGRTEWTWQTYAFPTASGTRKYLQRNSGVASRTRRDPGGAALGTWAYTQAPGQPAILNSREASTTVVDPLGHRTVNHFSVAMDANNGATGWSVGDYSLPFTRSQPLNVAAGVDLNLSRQVYNAAGTLLRSEYVLYERELSGPSAGGAATGSADNANRNRRMVRSRTTFGDDPGTYAGVIHSDFDGLGHYRRQQTEGNFPGSNVRTHHGHYNPARGTYAIDPFTGAGSGWSVFPSSSPWVLETMSFAWDAEGGATAYTDLCYAPGSATVVRQRVHRQDGAYQAAQDLVTVYDLDLAGTGNVTAEKSYGGDAQAGIPTATGDPCSMPLPAVPEFQVNHTYASGVRATSQHVGAGFYVLDQTIDPNTGLPTGSRDTSGLLTSYEYDALGRMTWSKPALGHGGWTELQYSAANPAGSTRASVTVRRRNNGSKTAAIQNVHQVVFDYFGRVYQETRRLPGGAFNKRETLYDDAGNKASVSELTTGAATSKTSFFNYDPFGRPGTIQPPDGSTHNVSLSYRGARQVERTVKVATAAGVEADALTTEVYDRHGRLLSVTEPSGDANANVATSYGYDVGNRLISVSATAYVPGTGNVAQSRSFSYDRAGLLQSETHPELGSSGNGSTSYPRYDSRGHLLRRIDGGSDLTFVYDGAERLTLVRETSGGQRTLKSFTYAGANGTFSDPATGTICTDNRKGRLLRQSRFNYVTIFGSPYTVELREGMTYCGRDGRRSRRTLDNYVNGAATPSESFVLPNITYDTLGNVTSLGYPECTHAACGAPSPRTVTFSYSEDLLTAVGTPANAGQYASSLTYHPNLMVSQVVHANALTDTYANDPNLMRRPASIAVTTSGGAVRWSTGSYAYDGAGNVKTIGTHAFTYDKVSRLKSANLYLEPNGSTNLRSQTFTYDAFGNLLAVGGHAGRNTPTTPGTNRLALASYDTSGNVTSWNGNAYAYDPFNLMWSYRTGSDEWVYLYTADDERAWSYKTDNTSLWALRGPDNKVLREYTTNGTWSVASDYIHRDGALLAAETPQGIRHFHVDHLGTPRLISDSLGQQKAYHVYYPYGDEATAFNQDTMRAKFTGHERDLNNPGGAGDDLDYMHARFFSPITGRFLSIDPADSARRSQPQSWNRYTYALGNPIRYFDPDGLDIVDALDGFVNAVGSNFLLGAGRVESSNPDFVAGQKLGDLTSLFLGAKETFEGGMLVIAGAGCTAGTSGGCAPVGAPVAVVGGVLAVHGVTVISNAANNLGKGISLQLNNGPGASGSAGNLKTVNDKHLKKLGIDAEKLKNDVVQGKGSRFNIAVDKNRNVFLVTVKKGQGVAIETGLTLDQAQQYYPRK